MTHFAAKACAPCRDRKRKCDKTFPCCSLCYRLGRKCKYGILEGVATPGDHRIAKSSNLRIHLPDYAVLPSLTDSGGRINFSIDDVITERLSIAVGDESKVRETADKYFSTIHMWFPIISSTSYYGLLSSNSIRPSAEYSLLSLSMALITKFPDEGSFGSLYALLKTSIALVEASNIHSLGVVQARLLVALFEVGHGMNPAAFISLAAAARAAVAIGLNQNINNPYSKNSELGLRVWWGLAILDRCSTLECRIGPCATQDLGSPNHLPRDERVCDQNISLPNEPLALSTPSSVGIGPFARQAQISHVLDLLILHLRNQNLHKNVAIEESEQFARTLIAFSKLLPEEAPQPWPRYCGAIGMCYSGLMILHESQNVEGNQNGETLSPELLEAALSGILRVAEGFNQKIDQVDGAAISPFPPHGIFKAALMQIRLWKKTSDTRYFEAANSLVDMLRHFSKRWLNADKCLKLLEKEWQ